jgi:hypothetical protein
MTSEHPTTEFGVSSKVNTQSFTSSSSFSSPSERRLIIATALNTVAAACASQNSALATSLSSFSFRAPSVDSIETHSGSFFYGTARAPNRSLVLLTEPLMCFQRNEGCEFSGYTRLSDDERTFRTALTKQLYGLLGVAPVWRVNNKGNWTIYLD